MKSNLLVEVEAFLSETGMGASYFGKRSTGNSELVSRLRDGKRVWPETEARVRSFIKERNSTLSKKVGDGVNLLQGSGKPDHGVSQ